VKPELAAQLDEDVSGRGAQAGCRSV